MNTGMHDENVLYCTVDTTNNCNNSINARTLSRKYARSNWVNRSSTNSKDNAIMRVTWQDAAGYYRQIDSDNPQLIADWLKEKIIQNRPNFENAAFPPPQITFRPIGDYNIRLWQDYDLQLSDKELYVIIEAFEKIVNDRKKKG